MRTREAVRTTEGAAPSLVRWGAVFSGALIGVGLMTVLSSLWLALSYNSHQRNISDHLTWFLGGSAILSVFVAGLIAGAVSGTRGPGAGLANGITTWALVVIALVATGLPTALAVGTIHPVHVNGTVYDVTAVTYWTGFWSLVIGLGAALLGGIVGGAMPRRIRYQVMTAGNGAVDLRDEPVVDEPAARTPAGARR